MSDSESDDAVAVVIDNGSAFMKGGFSGDDAPRSVFPTIIVTKLVDGQSPQRPTVRKQVIGDDAMKHKYDQDVTVTYPIERGEVSNWDKMEKIWHYLLYRELRVAPEEHSILLTEPGNFPKAQREKACQILFETFNVPAHYVAMAPVLSLYASGRTTGVVIDFGHQQTQCVPIYEGYALPHAIRKMRIGGQHITKYLQQALRAKQYDINEEIACAIKEKLLYVAENGMEHELKKAVCNKPQWLTSAYLRSIDARYSQYTSMEVERFCDAYCGDKTEFIRMKQEYKLPDGTVLQVSEEQFQCTEIMFQPSVLNDAQETEGIHEVLSSVIGNTDVDIRNDLAGNTVFSGGNSMFPGLSKRFERASKHKNYVYSPYLELVVPAERRFSAWIGGSILTSLSTFSQMWIRKEEYSSAGPSIVHRKCY